ncbi:hypothetical protein [Halopseudomonas pelagia]|uniref:Uncharacterized protein n=1 Tax=Halopseudomonas pelagia TaxID=553151 RepID=A0AA91Z4U7_9GAMM|nr:hypothetical protein [Halopseudomonas pelagia]PCC98297.1 hypothetical protein CO192_16045 [Halopseudomonas pelagia]QFY56688.1 hypothetical protein EAO82_10070 [Halopseudomonas pelagia]
MDFIFDFLINALAHRIGVCVLGVLNGGSFKGESGYAWGCAVVVGCVVLLTPIAAIIGWLIFANSR